ncbi:hypothetical protein BCF11_3555 [Collimonas sp. PA-H2]|uniref:hypothetical protein n=1 Tax=Collimonas sp. PA-H2 TaxID=1881062 RepID=UPI000BF69B93|nr:hypothetical protein [Collimonas sp. PA-H2]PFH11114.1 hypothetical protein BCF11_3555 [Collimonas sp. PA-H2]
MEWKPISQGQLREKLNEARTRMCPSQEHLWNAIKIIPEKWSQHPYGDVGGGFWAVAVFGEFVVWYNDIEDGFNRSLYKTHGVIEDYRCNQDELERIVQQILSMIENGYDQGSYIGPPTAMG